MKQPEVCGSIAGGEGSPLVVSPRLGDAIGHFSNDTARISGQSEERVPARCARPVVRVVLTRCAVVLHRK